MYAKSFVVLVTSCVILLEISEAKLDMRRLTSPDYPKPYPWSYWADEKNFYSDSDAYRIRIVVNTVQIHPRDTLTIYDGWDDCKSPMHEFRGSTEDAYLPMMMFSVSGKICLKFSRYNNVALYKGYEIDIFEFPRCHGNLTDEYGDIVSPNYNYVDYEADLNCEWRILAEKGQGVEFNVEEFSVGCEAGDEVSIDDGTRNISLCEKNNLTSTDTFLAENYVAKLRFKTKSTDKGFWIAYKMVGCPEPGISSAYGSQVNPSNYYPYGYTTVYRCPEGQSYDDSVDTLAMTCLNTGKWRTNHKLLGCQPISCRDPGTPSNAKRLVSDKKFRFKSSVSYRCDPRHTLEGDSSRVCQADGKWSGVEPVCKGVLTKCRLPPDPEFGFRNGDDTSIGAVVSFGCEEGYRLVGSESILCARDALWSKATPTCEIVKCPAPVVPVHGAIAKQTSSAVYHYGHYVEFVCDEGFRMVSNGDGVADCLNNGTWDEESPVCEGIRCRAPTLPVNGNASYTSVEYGAEARYYCFAGYTLDGAYLSRCEETGWSSVVPLCNPVLCTVLSNDSLTNAYVTSEFVGQSGGFYHFGQEAEVLCDEGYSLLPNTTSTSATVECGETGEWNYNVTGGCLHEIRCPELTAASLPTSAVLLEWTSLNVTGTALVHCETTDRVVALICGSTGQWNVPLKKVCDGNDTDNSNAAATREAQTGFSLWIIILIVVGSAVVIAAVGAFIFWRRRNKPPTKSDTPSDRHEYDNPVYGVSGSQPGDQVTIDQDLNVGFKKGDDWQSNPTYHGAAQTLERPESFFTEEGLYGNVDDYSKRAPIS